MSKPSKHIWKTPVNEKVHDQLLSLGWEYIESHWENEFAVSEYHRGEQIKRVEQSGRMLDGKA